MNDSPADGRDANLNMTASEMLTEVLEKPGLYVTHGSVVQISAFIEGYVRGKGEPSDFVYNNFGQWLRKKYEIRQDLGWAAISCFIGGSESGAFEFAKEMWKKYLKEAPHDPIDS